MKTLFVLTSVIIVLFLASPTKVEAQKRKTNKSKQAQKQVGTDKENNQPATANSPKTQEGPKRQETAKPVAKGAKATPEEIAQAMVRAVRINDHVAVGPPGSLEFTKVLAAPTTEQETQSLTRWFDKAQEVVSATPFGKSVGRIDGNRAMKVLAVIRAYYVTRRSAVPEEQIPQKLAEYEARFNRVTSDFFTPAHSRLFDKPVDFIREYPSPADKFAHDVLTVAATVFHDFLWEGGNWKEGNPQRALTRLRSLWSTEAASKWEAAARIGKISDPEFAPWSLLAVDTLFANDVFQEKVFEEAFPIALQELAR